MKDFAMKTEDFMDIYRCDKASASNRLTLLRKKLGKPKQGIVMASEFCEKKGISLDQLRILVDVGVKNSKMGDLVG